MNIMIHGELTLYSSSSLQVLFDFRCVLIVEPCCFLIELHVTFIDIVHASIMVKCFSQTELSSSFNPATYEDI